MMRLGSPQGSHVLTKYGCIVSAERFHISISTYTSMYHIWRMHGILCRACWLSLYARRFYASLSAHCCTCDRWMRVLNGVALFIKIFLHCCCSVRLLCHEYTHNTHTHSKLHLFSHLLAIFFLFFSNFFFHSYSLYSHPSLHFYCSKYCWIFCYK